MVDNNLYLYGGFARDIFSDIRVLDFSQRKWKLFQLEQKPHERLAHTMVAHEGKLFVFGGAGQYLSTVKTRLSFNDVNIFDTVKEEWIESIEN